MKTKELNKITNKDVVKKQVDELDNRNNKCKHIKMSPATIKNKIKFGIEYWDHN